MSQSQSRSESQSQAQSQSQQAQRGPPNAEQQGYFNLQHPTPIDGREQQSTENTNVARPGPRGNATSTSIGRAPTGTTQSRATRFMDGRKPTATSAMSRSNTNQTQRLSDAQRLEKKQQQTVDVEEEYMRLNPWYNEQKEKPVFGLGQPLPHTMRRGMWWGRSDLKKKLDKLKEEENQIREEMEEPQYSEKDFGQDSEGSQEPLTDDGSSVKNQHPIWNPRRYTSQGQMSNIRRPGSTNMSMAGAQDREKPDRAPVNEHGLTDSNQNGNTQGRNQFGLQDGLHPLQELDTNNTSATQKEQKEIQEREHKEQQTFYDQYRNPIARFRAQYPQAPAEFLATFVYLFLGISANLSIATSQQQTGTFESQAWAWGFAVTVGIYLSGGVSGGHLSPTVTLALSVFRGFPWKMAIVYICMQMLAGLAAGGLAYALYSDAIHSVDPKLTLDITGKALFPKGPAFSATTGFFNDFVFMAVYVCIAFALGDDQNSPPGQGMTALVFGFMGYLMMVALGYNTGLGISPARDLGPRLVGLWAGYTDAFADPYWAYGPWGASISGALFGGFIYDLFIFVGGESPVNYRWPEPGDIKWKMHEKKEQTKEQIHHIV